MAMKTDEEAHQSTQPQSDVVSRLYDAYAMLKDAELSTDAKKQFVRPTECIFVWEFTNSMSHAFFCDLT